MSCQISKSGHCRTQRIRRSDREDWDPLLSVPEFFEIAPDHGHGPGPDAPPFRLRSSAPDGSVPRTKKQERAKSGQYRPFVPRRLLAGRVRRSVFVPSARNDSKILSSNEDVKGDVNPDRTSLQRESPRPNVSYHRCRVHSRETSRRHVTGSQLRSGGPTLPKPANKPVQSPLYGQTRVPVPASPCLRLFQYKRPAAWLPLARTPVLDGPIGPPPPKAIYGPSNFDCWVPLHTAWKVAVRLFSSACPIRRRKLSP